MGNPHELTFLVCDKRMNGLALVEEAIPDREDESFRKGGLALSPVEGVIAVIEQTPRNEVVWANRSDEHAPTLQRSGLSLFGGGECWRPQSVDGQHVEAVVVGVRARACGEDDPRDKPLSQSFAELRQAAKV